MQRSSVWRDASGKNSRSTIWVFRLRFSETSHKMTSSPVNDASVLPSGLNADFDE